MFNLYMDSDVCLHGAAKNRPPMVLADISLSLGIKKLNFTHFFSIYP